MNGAVPVKVIDQYPASLKPRIGSIVLYRSPDPKPDYFEGADRLPAIITKVYSINVVDLVVFSQANHMAAVQVERTDLGEGPGHWVWPDNPHSENPLEL
jgi:hypothetical protein